MYATLDNLVDRVGLEVLQEWARGQIDTVAETDAYKRVVQALEAATNLINSYVQSKYPVPLNPVPAVVKDKAVDIALYQLTSWRGLDPEGEGKPLVTNYKAAEAWLKDVAKGLVSLGPAPAPPPPAGVEIVSNRPIFSRDQLKGW